MPIYENGDKTGCSNYRGIPLLATTCRMLSNILILRLIPYIDDITGDH